MKITGLTHEIYKQLYKITALSTPLKENCGDLCGRACCRPGKQDALGIYLFPGEEIMFNRQEEWLKWEEHDPVAYDFPASWQKPVYFVRCNGSCSRQIRPLACRFFPLTPHLHRDGNLQLIYETLNLPYHCPLITEGTPLEQHFIRTVKTAWEILLQDSRIRDLVEEDSRHRESEGLPVIPLV